MLPFAVNVKDECHDLPLSHRDSTLCHGGTPDLVFSINYKRTLVNGAFVDGPEDSQQPRLIPRPAQYSLHQVLHNMGFLLYCIYSRVFAGWSVVRTACHAVRHPAGAGISSVKVSMHRGQGKWPACRSIDLPSPSLKV